MSSQAFTRAHRLTLPAEYNEVFAAGKRVSIGSFTVVVRRTDGPARLGLAIAKKQIKHAVGRNRIKRLAREAFRRHLELLKGIELIAMVKNSASMRSNAELEQELRALFERCTQIKSAVPPSTS
jgi:ribonuclease P protein component